MLLKNDPSRPERNRKAGRVVSRLMGTRKRMASLVAFILFAVVVAGGAFSIGALAYKLGLSQNIDSLLKRPSVALGVEKLKPYLFVLQGIVDENIRIPGNYLTSFTAVPENLHIDIKHQDFQKIAYMRDQAIVNRHLEKSKNAYVPAQIRHRDKTYDVKLRLKGDNIDHLHGEKWSYRIKVRSGDAFMGMKNFSVQHPKTRNFVFEWLFHRALDREGIINLRYDFVNISVNGKDLGVFALEEHFEKRLLESNQRREGPILKFNEDVAWLTGTVATNGKYAYMTSPIDAFEKDKLRENPTLDAQFKKAAALLEAFRQGDLPTSEVFDVDKLARYYAVTELLGADHGNAFFNLRFYYNPITSRLEPIGFDANAGKAPAKGSKASLWDPLRISRAAGSSSLRLFEEQLFDDFAFFKAYMTHLQRIVEPQYLEAFLQEVEPELQEKLAILYREFPYYHYDRELLAQNQRALRESITPARGVNAWMSRTKHGEFAELEISNILDVPLEIEAIETSTPGTDEEPEIQHRFELESQAIAQPIPLGGFAPSTALFRFKIPEGTYWSEAWNDQLTVVYRFVGSDHELREPVNPIPRTQENLASELTRLAPNASTFAFIEFDDPQRVLRFSPGLHRIDRDLILPRGYTAYAGPGVTLRLEANANLVSYAALHFVGTPDNPVEITSDGGQGFVVLEPEAPSFLENVRFVGLRAPDRSGWGLTGAVTFYGTKVDFRFCQFINNDSEDALNLVLSDFEISDSVFLQTRSDSLDSDFSHGTISRSQFSGAGNDAVDVSGTRLTLNDVTIRNFGDKGLSAGEGSHINANNVQILDGAVAVASKDSSTIQVNGLLIKDSRVGFTAYRKKPEFGHATIFADAAVLDEIEVPHLIEKRSQLTLNGKEVVADETNVESLMYGGVYGKASK